MSEAHDARQALPVQTARRVATGLLAVCTGVTLAFAWIAARHSHFHSDDMLSLYQLRRVGAMQFTLLPINQWVPLHRLATVALDAAFGYRFTPAVGALLCLHLAGLAVLYRVCRRLTVEEPAEPGMTHRDPRLALGRVLIPATVTLAYGGYLLVGEQLLWFSSGLHRLPYALATLVAFDRWLSFRRTGRARELVLVLLALLMASGFYAKGPLLVPHVIALELCLWQRTSVMHRRRNAAALVGLLVAAIMVAAASAHLGRNGLSYPGAGQLLAIEFEALRVLLRSLAGQLAGPDTPLRRDPGLFVGMCAAGALALSTIRRRPANAWIWLVMSVCVVANMAVLGLSDRGAVFGRALSHGHRYYLEQLVVVLPLLSLTLPDLLGSPFAQRTWTVAAALLAALAVANVLQFRDLFATQYAAFAQTRAFVDHFHSELARIRDTTPNEERIFQDELLPRPLLGLAPDYNRWSHMAEAMNLRLRFSDHGRFLIEADGSIVPKGATYDPARRERALADYLEHMRRAIERARGLLRDD